MKIMKLLLILLVTLPFFVYSQEPLTFSEVVLVPSINKDELFNRGREWFNENFKSSKDVLQIADKESGELIGKGIMEVVYVFKYLGARNQIADVNFTISIWVKEERYKFEFTNFIASGDVKSFDFGLITTSDETNKDFANYSDAKMDETYLSLKKATILKANLLIEDLKLKMSQKSKSSDW